MAYYRVLFCRVLIAFILTAGIYAPHILAQDLSQADRLFKKALKLQNIAEYDSSSALLRQAILHFETANKRGKTSKFYNELSFNAHSQHKLSEAERFAQNVLRISKEYSGIPAAETATAYHNLGIIDTERNNYENALHWLKKGIALKALIPIQVEAGLITGIGSVYHEQGKYNLAMEQFGTGVEMLNPDNPDHQKKLAILYNYIGVNYVSKGSYDQALLFYEKELIMNQSLYGEGHPNVAGVYNNLGGLSYRSGDVGKAIGYFKKAASSFRQVYGINHPSVAMAYNNIGASYFQLGKPQQATGYLKKSAEIKKKVRGPNHPDLAVSYNNLGSILLELGKYEKAKKYLRFSLSIRKSAFGADHPELTNTYNSLGILLLKQNKPDSAVYYFKNEVEITRTYRGENHPYFADALNNIAKAYTAQGFFENALNFHQQALKVLSIDFKDSSYSHNPQVDSIRYPNFALNVLSDKGKTLYKYFTQNKNAALLKAGLASYHSLSNLLDFLQSGFQNKQSKLLMSRESHEIYEYAIKTAYRLFKETNEHKYLKQAFYFAEKSKTRVILELIKTQQAKKFAGLPNSLVSYEKQLRNKLTKVHQQLIYAIDAPGKANQTGHLRDSLFSLKRSLNQHLSYLEKEFPRYHKLKYNHEIPKVDSIQQSLDKQNLTLVEYFYGSQSAWAFVMEANRLSLTPLPYDSSLTESINRFNQSIIQQSDSLYLKLGFRLYDQLLQPIVKQLRNKNILFVPDGALNLLPFEALLVSSASKAKSSVPFTDLKYLINYFSISYSPSVSLSTLSEAPPDHTYPSDFAAFAPINFSDEVNISENRGDGESWPILPSTGYEVQQIAKLFKPEDSFWNHLFGKEPKPRLYIRNKATEKAFKTADLSNYRFLHLATHAFASDTGYYHSGIVFHPDDNSYEDGILFSEEIYNLKLQNKLAVLSACETGTGQVMKGEGIIGLSRAFKYAGVENLLVSLWKVDDRSTARLMIDFYTRQIEGASFSDALRSAKRELIAYPAYAHPKFWAPFIFIGR